MPFKAKRPCTHAGCPQFAEDNNSKCAVHQRKERMDYDARRGDSGERGYDSDWQAVRKMFATRHPLCKVCVKQGRDKALDVVHHIKSIEERPDLRLDMDNLQSLCTEHHEKIHKAQRWRR